jgi:hypothetical protein
VHQQEKEESDRYAPAGKGGEGQMCTNRPRTRGPDVHSRPRIRGTDMHQQAKEKRTRYAPAGNE